ncbi:hypothetical protein E1284_27640, partial [Actinomadura bangladeshensis]
MPLRTRSPKRCPPMQIEILGGLRIKDDHGREITLDGRRPRLRSRNLIFVLAYQPWDPALSAEELGQLLWEGDQAGPSALASLVRTTRQWLPADCLITTTGDDGRDRYQVPRGAAHRVDVDDWRQAVALAERARDGGDLDTAVRRYDEALDLWQRSDWADPLPDMPGTPAMQDERELLLQQLRDVSARYVEARMDTGDRSLALADRIRDLMTRQPVDSRLIGRHMMVLYQAGRKEAALAAYEDATRVFDTAFDTASDASPDLEPARLYGRILRDDPGLRWSPLTASPPRRARAVLTTGGLSARGVHDAALGGKDNTQADRDLLDTLTLEVGDGYREALVDSRHALAGIVERCRRAGIRQWLDLGSGMPAPPPHRQVHEIARDAPAGPARVLYIDNDPVVAVHAGALMADYRDVVFRQADLTDAAEVLYEARQLFDLRRPVAVLAAGSLPHVGRADRDLGTAELAEVLGAYMDALPDGSVLAITHVTGDRLAPGLRPHLDATV